MAKNPEKKFVHFVPEPKVGHGCDECGDCEDCEPDEGMLLDEMIGSIHGMLLVVEKAQTLMNNTSVQDTRDDLRGIQVKATRLACTMINNIEVIEHVVVPTETKGN
jgi:hypothetical protein